MDYLDSFGEWLRQRREALRLTRAELARCAGCSVSALRKIEADERRPSRQLAELLAGCLCIAPEEQPTFLDAARGAQRVARLGRPTPLATRLPPSPLARSSGAAAGPLSAGPDWNLPAPATPLIGREAELAALAQLLDDPNCRLLTLVGPGGIGKSRLAIEVACLQWGRFVDGVHFASLASISSPEHLVPAIAQAIGLNFAGPADPHSQLVNYLRNKQVLLLLDNLEHLLKGVEEVTAMLAAAPRLKLLVTSRERLELQVEWVLEVQGLPVPAEGEVEELEKYSAVQLFLQRARRVRVDYELTVEDCLDIVRICRLVEGMPLAIELAATWLKLLSPSEIASEVEHNLDFLNAQMRDLPERHRSIRAVFDPSWQMLSTEEKQVLGRLSVFRGGFGREAAEQVAGASLPVLSSLIIRSLLRRTAAGRYDLHELIRQYAASKLAEDPHELHTIQERHSVYYLGLLEEEGPKLQSNRQKEAVAALAGDIANIRTAWDWSVADQRFIPLYQVSAELNQLFEVHNWFKEGEVTFRKTADKLRASLPGSAADAVHQVALNAMLAHCGYFRLRLGRGEEAYAILSPSAAFLRTAFLQMGADPLPAIYSLLYLGIGCWILGRFSEAEECLRESLALARTYRERWYEAMNSEFLGRLAIDQGEYNQARQYLSEALTILRQLGEPSLTAHTLSYLGRTMQILGEYGQAEKLLRESLEVAQEIGYRFAIGLARDGLGHVAYAQERYEDAQAFFSESAELFRQLGDIHRLSRTLNHQGFNALALSQEAEARNAFNAALKMAYEGSWMPTTLQALIGLAALDTSQKASKGTLELALYILQHPSSSQETKNLAARLRAELESRLTQEEIEVARERAGSVGPDELVRQFLAGA